MSKTAELLNNQHKCPCCGALLKSFQEVDPESERDETGWPTGTKTKIEFVEYKN